MKKTIEEVRDYLLENRVSEAGDLNLIGIDFSDFEGDIVISGMKVKWDLYQGGHEVGGDLYQVGHKVGDSLYQYSHKVQGNLYHGDNKVSGDVYEKLLKEINAKELAKLGYKFKE